MLISVIDIGGGHISFATFDTSTALLVDEVFFEHFSEDGAVGPLDVLMSVAKRVTARGSRQLGGFSIGVPAPFDYSAGISQMQHKLVQLYGVDLKRALSEASHLRPESIVFLNDADAFLLGALKTSPFPKQRTIGIALGTGIGSGFAIDGEVVTTGVGVPPGGEIWNLPFGQGTVEDAISTSSIVSAYAGPTGCTLTVKAIAEQARAGNTQARDVFAHFGLQLSQVLAQIGKEFSPQQILLGGGIVAAADLFFPYLQLDHPERVMIVQNAATAPLTGAGVAWKKNRAAEVLAMAGAT